MTRIPVTVMFSLSMVLPVALPSISFGQAREHRPAATNDRNNATKQTPDQTVWQQGTVQTQSNTIDAQLPASSPTGASGTVSTLPKPY